MIRANPVMRITHIITRLIIGGAQENTVSTLMGLNQIPGLELNLISGPSQGPEGTLEPDVLKVPGLLTKIPELVRPVHPAKDLVALVKLEKALRRQQPHIVHTHSGKAGILGRIAAHRAGVPVIIHHIHGPSFGPFQGTLANQAFTLAERFAGRYTHHFFCSAAAMARIYLKAGIGRPEFFTRIFSSFPLEPYLQSANLADLRMKWGLHPSHFVIGKVARLVPLKGHADLLEAFACLAPRVPRARLLLVGDGVLRSQLEQHARKLGILDRVVFAGLVQPSQVPVLVGIMDCLAHLSFREALSRALPQALAAGKPVVSYDFDGANELCQNGDTGFLISSGDFHGVAAALEQLAGNPSLCQRLGKTGRDFVAANFRVDKMVQDQLAVYKRLALERGLVS